MWRNPLISRRAFVAQASAVSLLRAAGTGPRVALAKCRDYAASAAALTTLCDQIGGLGRVVKGKTVTVKVNLGGPGDVRLGYLPCERTHWVHPVVIGTLLHLLDRAGARRIRLVEGSRYTADSLQDHMWQAGWDPARFLSAGTRVELANTNTGGADGRRAKYVRFPVSAGKPLLFPAFDLHPAYSECDVFISLTKMKEHLTAGVTLSMKNCFGITPTSIYGDSAGKDEPNEDPRGGRGDIMHRGARQPSSAAPSEVDPESPREGSWRVPRIITDIVAARPVDLAFIDGIETMAGGEGVKSAGVRPVKPGLLIAGTNCVAVDAIAMAAMGFDPMAFRGTAPFERCDSTLQLAADRGLGPRNPDAIDLAGPPLASAVFRFRR